ncbi:MAG: type II toxin-antitoxin system RelE/ParE family toxin [Alphaproteobacteria bacterium]|nr:type II toxin-antitoxin system RelE/ParE family toxin [Alphaproteobacteria bacterium]
MRLTLNEEAGNDLETIREYIARDSPAAAGRVAAMLLSGLSLLANHPHLGRPGRVAGTREFVFSNLPYIGVYRVHENIGLIEVLRIVHTARYYPPDDLRD